MYTRREFGLTFAAAAAVGASGYFLEANPGWRRLLPGGERPDAGAMELLSRTGKVSHLSDLDVGPSGALLYLFRMSCHWCSRNRLSINSLSEQLRGRFVVVGMILDDEWPPDGTYLFPVYHYRGNVAALRASATPTTCVVGSDYRLKGRLEGAYTGPVREELAASLGVELADL